MIVLLISFKKKIFCRKFGDKSPSRVQAARIIRGFAIRGFDNNSRTKQQGKAANKEGKNTVLAQIRPKWTDWVFEDSKLLWNVTPTNSNKNVRCTFCSCFAK